MGTKHAVSTFIDTERGLGVQLANLTSRCKPFLDRAERVFGCLEHCEIEEVLEVFSAWFRVSTRIVSDTLLSVLVQGRRYTCATKIHVCQGLRRSEHTLTPVRVQVGKHIAD